MRAKRLRFEIGAADISLDRFGLKITRYEKVRQRDDQIVPVSVAPGNRGIPRPIHQAMVIDVVGRNPHQGRVAIEQGEHVPKGVVRAAADERRAMIVVVGDGTAGDAQIASRRQDVEDDLGLSELEHHHRGSKRHPKHGANVRERLSCIESPSWFAVCGLFRLLSRTAWQLLPYRWPTLRKLSKRTSNRLFEVTFPTAHSLRWAKSCHHIKIDSLSFPINDNRRGCSIKNRGARSGPVPSPFLRNWEVRFWAS